MSFSTALARFEPVSYALFRVVFGLLFLVHGTQKLFRWPPPAVVKTLSTQVWIGGGLELVLGALIALGLFTRPAAFLASGMMAVAYVQFHWKPWLDGADWLPIVNKGEAALLYAFAFLFVSARGGGPASIDRTRA